MRRTVRFDHANYDVVVVAASYGGLATLREILGMLPATYCAPMILVQHISDASPGHVPNLLTPHTSFHVRHAVAGDRLRSGTLLIAPPGRHLLLDSDAVCLLSDSSRVNFTRPAADPLFSSAAKACGSRTLGVILSGRHRDGTSGARDVRAVGGVIIAQEPDTCLARGMPESAINAGAADLVLTPALIAAALVTLVTVPGAPMLFGFNGKPRSAA